MTRRSNPLVLQFTLAMMAVVFLGGCANRGQHKKWVDNADLRWNGMRATALIDMAQGQFDSGQLDLAESTIRDAAAISPENPKVHLLSGRIALENGLLERATHHFGAALEKDDTLADAHYFRAVVFQRWQKNEDALADYQAAAKLDSEHPGRILAVAETLVTLDRTDEAVALLEAKKVHFDQNAGCRAMLGHIHVMEGKYAQAVENFREAVLLDPENMRVKEELAFAQVASQDWPEAVLSLRELTARDDYAHRNDLWRALAKAEAENGRENEARTVYLNLTRRNPGDVNDWIRLGEVCWKIEDLGGALIAANRTINLAPKRHEGYLLAGLVWQKRERTHEALQMFDAAAKAAPANPTPVILRGIALQKNDRLAAAAEAYREALRRSPDDTRALSLLTRLEQGAMAQ
ncbi:MAG: tetratricopeptide repeat protein [Algisphaera sp.]